MSKTIDRYTGQERENMNICAFYGSGYMADTVKTELEKTITKLILQEKVDRFYCVYENNFDRIVLEILKNIKNEYPQVSYFVVSSGKPADNLSKANYILLNDSPRKYSLHSCRLWMFRESSLVVSYCPKKNEAVNKFKEYALLTGKKVISINGKRMQK